MKRTHFYLGISILLAPVLIYFLLFLGKPQYDTLPIFGEKIAPDGKEIKDTIYYTIPPFKVLAHTGDSIAQKDLNDGILLVNFFFATCKDVCPSMNRRLKEVYDELQGLQAKNKEVAEKKNLKQLPPVRILSFTVDPEQDSLEALKQYAKKFDIKANDWFFARTEKEPLFQIGRGFLLPVSIEDRTIDHSQQILLIDTKNRIRGMYDALDDAEMKRLKGEIKVLLYEYLDKQ